MKLNNKFPPTRSTSIALISLPSPPSPYPMFNPHSQDPFCDCQVNYNKTLRVVVVEGFTAEPSLGRLSMLHIEFYVSCETKIVAITSNQYYSPVQPYIHPRCFKAGLVMKLAVGQEPEP